MSAMNRVRVFVTRNYHLEAAELLGEHFEVEVWPDNVSPPSSVLVQKASEVGGMFVESFDAIDEDVLEAGKTLRVVANRGVGYNNVEVVAATRLGILVGNTPGILQESCADMVFGLILAVARRVVYADSQVKAGAWSRLDQTPYLGTDVYGRTLGIVGMGGIGSAVSKRAKGFDMNVLYHSRTRKPEKEENGVEWAGGLDRLLRDSDFVSLHVPLTGETQGLIGKRELRMMKSGAFLVNTSRGPTVDSKALHEALVSGEIAGAALDVTDPEPIPADDPLLSLPNVIVTPHIASASAETFKAMARMTAENIIAALTGKPMPSCVNPEALGHRSS